jgi:two-component system, OmpR family, KDP operon response regulator KdpE
MSERPRATILVVEDEPRLVRLLRAVLESGGYRMDAVHDGAAAIARVALDPPDLVLLDLRLPGDLDGYAVCERIREFALTPIIMVTARAREDEKLRGFAAGADDYVTKPFSARELLARVQAVLRRTTASDTQPRVMLGDLTIDLATRLVTRDNAPIHLTPTEYRLLLTLAQHPGKVLTHSELLTAVWGSEYRDEVEYLRTYVRYLRQKLEPEPTQPRYLLTHPGIGYSLAADL